MQHIDVRLAANSGHSRVSVSRLLPPRYGPYVFDPDLSDDVFTIENPDILAMHREIP